MKVNIDINEQYNELEVDIRNSCLSPEIEKIISMLRMMDMQLSVERDGTTYILDVSKIVYVEAVERKTFIYTESEMYESQLKLYEMEQQLEQVNFFRISKSCLVNLKMIKSLKTDINRKIRITLKNGEQIVVSRMYADELRRRLGVK